MARNSYRYCVLMTFVVFTPISVSCISEAQITGGDFFGKTDPKNCMESFGMSIHGVKVHYSISASHCAVYCKKHEDCFKFLYCGVPGSKNCYPIQRTGILSSDSKIKECTCHIKEAPQCDNGGIMKSSKCVCRNGFFGDRCELLYQSCEDAARNGVLGFRPINIRPVDSTVHFPVLCGNENNESYTYIQRRLNPGLNMRGSWLTYQRGFGGLRGNFWMGLNQIRILLESSTTNVLEIGLLCDIGEAEKFKLRTVQYANFSIGDEADGYTIHLDGFSTGSDNGNHLRDALSSLNGQKFRTHDRDSSPTGCASQMKDGWWYGANCMSGNLNAVYSAHYMPGVNETIPAITWNVTNVFIHIKEAYMKIKSG